MKRIEAIREILNTLTDEFLFSSCGKISREIFYIRDRPQNFYVMGSMGATLPVAIGFALSRPDLRVVVIIGDGEALMSLDSLVLLKWLQKREKMKNFELLILDNNQYQSTGGQPTISNAIDFRSLCFCRVIFCGESEVEVPRITIPHEEITRRFRNAIG